MDDKDIKNVVSQCFIDLINIKKAISIEIR